MLDAAESSKAEHVIRRWIMECSIRPGESRGLAKKKQRASRQLVREGEGAKIAACRCRIIRFLLLIYIVGVCPEKPGLYAMLII